jgi:hypothetical protein
LRENDRGQFLTIKAVTYGTTKAQIFIPAQILQDLRNNLNELLDENNDGKTKQNKTESLQFISEIKHEKEQ